MGKHQEKNTIDFLSLNVEFKGRESAEAKGPIDRAGPLGQEFHDALKGLTDVVQQGGLVKPHTQYAIWSSNKEHFLPLNEKHVLEQAFGKHNGKGEFVFEYIEGGLPTTLTIAATPENTAIIIDAYKKGQDVAKDLVQSGMSETDKAAALCKVNASIVHTITETLEPKQPLISIKPLTPIAGGQSVSANEFSTANVQAVNTPNAGGRTH